MARRRLAWTSLAAFAATTAVCASAHAEHELEWSAPAACPGASALLERVEANLGRPLADGEVDATVAVTQVGKRWRMALTLRTTAGEGERSLDAASCDELIDAAALIVAMTIGDEAAAEVDEPPPLADEDLQKDLAALAASDDETPPNATAVRRQVDTSVREPRPPVDVDVHVRAAAGGELGTLPEPSSGFGGGVEIGFDAWSLDVAGTYWREQRGFVAGPTSPGADASLTTIVARGCYSGVDRRLRFGGCIGAEVDAMRSQGFDFDVVYPAQTTYGFGAHFGVLWTYRIAGPVAARADISAALLFARPVLTEDMDGAIIHDPNFLTWRGLVGAEVEFE